MSTHHWFCAWCGSGTGCCADEHLLACGQDCCCDAKNIETVDFKPDYTPVFTLTAGRPYPVEFCSIKCFMALRAEMDKRLGYAKADYPEWFKGE